MNEKSKQGRNYKVVGLLTIIASFVAIYFIFFFHSFEMIVFNKTNYDIDSLAIGNKFFHINKGDSLIVDNCKSISMQSGLPFGLPKAKIKGLIKDTLPIFLCGTGVKEIKNGNYQFDITISKDNNLFRLYWQRHK